VTVHSERRAHARQVAHDRAVSFAQTSAHRCDTLALHWPRRPPRAAAKPTVLIVDSVSPRRHRLAAAAALAGYRVLTAWTPLDAIAHLAASHGRLVLTAIGEDARDGVLLRGFIADAYPELHVVVIADRLRAGTLLEHAIVAAIPVGAPIGTLGAASAIIAVPPSALAAASSSPLTASSATLRSAAMINKQS
jgi:CheY-like chemotaxis protein